MAAASTLVDHSSNGPLMEATIIVGFAGTGSTLADIAEDSNSIFGSVPASGTTSTLSVAASAPLGGGVGTAAGNVTTEVMYGLDPTDGFEFSGTIVLSALSALNSAGNPAGAQVDAFGSLTFFLDPGFGAHPITGLPTVAGDLVGKLLLGPLGPLDPFETLRSIEVVKDPGLPSESMIASLLAGDPGTAVELHIGSGYQVKFSYGAFVPFGIDPTFTPNFTASTVVIPEPSSQALAMLALFAWIGCRRCRRRKPLV